MRETNQQEVELVDTPLPAFKHLLRCNKLESVNKNFGANIAIQVYLHWEYESEQPQGRLDPRHPWPCPPLRLPRAGVFYFRVLESCTQCPDSVLDL